ncbi:MAG TPA: M23 family metallopeptidase [Thermoleophilaceae bacterium]|nr:M23 family metallopeptidase [Thermoleophilaceae bacterium]
MRLGGRGAVERRVAFAAIVATTALWTLASPPAQAETWTWPVRGHVLTAYVDAGGPYAPGQHRGVDIAASAGTPVVAAAGGRVRFAGLVGSSGLTVSARTADGRLDISYLHLDTATVRAGQSVGLGQRIGTVGTSGDPSTSAPHLHFGVRDAGTRRYRDPLDLLPPLPGVREAPRGVPVPVRGPVRVGPAPQPVRPHRFRVAERRPVAAPASRIGWAIACGALICAAALLGTRSSIGARAVLRHHADLLRQR